MLTPYTTEVSLEITFFEPTYKVRFSIELQSSLCTYTPRFDPHFVKNPRFVCVYLKKFLSLTAIQTHPYTHTPYTIMASSVDHGFLQSNGGHTSLTFSA